MCLTASLIPTVLEGGRPAFRLLELLPGFTIRFQLEPLGLGFALIASALWFITTIFSIGYMRSKNYSDQTRFYIFFALAITATIGAAFAANLLTLYIFYEALTLATYPLVTHKGTSKDRAGGRIYITILLGTSLTFLLAAIAWTWSITGTVAFVDGGIFMDGNTLIDGVTPGQLAVILTLFVFGTGKAALMPFHHWLPAAMVAPTPVSALLHAVAVVKLGVFTILKISIYIFGIGTFSQLDIGQFILYIAATTLIVSAIIAIREDNIKRRLAYSTISQLSYIVIAAIIANSLTLLAGGIHIAIHAFSKITLFFCAGVILVSLNITKISELNGIGRKMPITMTSWVIASFCVIGIPLTGGFWSKWYLAQGALEAINLFITGIILLGSLLAFAYLIPPAVSSFFGNAKDQFFENKPKNMAEAPLPMLGAIVFTAIMSVALFFLVPAISTLLQGIEGLG